MGFHGMLDTTFFVCGIRDWLESFAGYKIQIVQTSFGMQDWTKTPLQHAESDLIFSLDIGSMHSNLGLPLATINVLPPTLLYQKRNNTTIVFEVLFTMGFFK